MIYHIEAYNTDYEYKLCTLTLLSTTQVLYHKMRAFKEYFVGFSIFQYWIFDEGEGDLAVLTIFKFKFH